MNKKGKAYSGRKKKSERPIGDSYHTPKSLVWVAEPIIRKEFNIKKWVLEPCCGMGAISKVLKTLWKYDRVFENDLYNIWINHNLDYLKTSPKSVKQVITNPPFSLWDDFVLTAKTHCKKFMYIGRLNYFWTQSRLEKGIWKNLKGIYPFSRYVDYQTPYRTDGHFHVGQMATAWFLWDLEYKGLPTIKQLDVQQYATLGAFKK